LPQLVTEVLAIIDDGEMEISRIVDKISRDQVLTARVLKVANSPYYGYSRCIDSLKDAGVMLGIHTLRDIVLTAAVVSRFPLDEARALDRRELWHHAEMTGIIARLLAGWRGLDRESAFTAGLLHDIGKLALDACFPEVYRRIFYYRAEQQCSLLEAEAALLGFDHCQAGLRLAQHWQLPQQICEAIEKHHAPNVDPHSSSADLIHVADGLSRHLERGKEGEASSLIISNHALERLGLEERFIDEWREELGPIAPDADTLFTH
ncbi:MAG: HDOD domain-containing protein, partial [Gammaproteobacteria bacterium]|nr:HDOD domain-containing protein [Gammaproteobacteria bacterium]